MRFAHPPSEPCPPSRDDGTLIVGPGGIRVDEQGVEWCCHASPLLADTDVAAMRLEKAARDKGVKPNPPEKRPSRFPEQANLPDLASLMPERDEDGRPVNAADVRFDIERLRQPETVE